MSPGEVAYNAYCRRVDWKSVKGEPLPEFDDQSQRLKTAWESAAAAVIAAVQAGDIQII